MGTSKSYRGPKDSSPDMPDWAESNGGDTDKQDDSEDDNLWENAKKALTYVATGTSEGEQGIAKASRKYVKAKGGAGAASSAASSGRQSTVRLGGFLQQAVSRGVPSALSDIGLERLTGQDAHTVITEVVSELAPSGADAEEAAARSAMIDTLKWLYDSYVKDAGSIEAIESMTNVDIEAAIEYAIGAYVYHRWLQELGISLEKGAISSDQATRLEKQVRKYIQKRVELDFRDTNILEINWGNRYSKGLIRGLFEEAYALLEAAQ